MFVDVDVVVEDQCHVDTDVEFPVDVDFELIINCVIYGSLVFVCFMYTRMCMCVCVWALRRNGSFRKEISFICI